MNAGKKLNGRKRHIVVDTSGLLLVTVITAANVQTSGAFVLWAMVGPMVRRLAPSSGPWPWSSRRALGATASTQNTF